MLSKLSIAIPTYNRNSYLLKLLETIPDTFAGKVVVSDNGGHVTDEIRTQYNQFSFIRLKNQVQMFQNWNIAINSIETEWFIMPSDDDLFVPGAFNDIEEVLKQNQTADIFIFGHNVINETDEVLTSWRPDKFQSFNSPQGFRLCSKGVDARCPSIIFKTDLVRRMGMFKEEFEYTAADSLLIHRCLLYGQSVFIPKIISSYRTWPNNFTSQLISTKGWLDKIQLWVDLIEENLERDFPKEDLVPSIANFKDEIFARNLLAGLSERRKKNGVFNAMKFISDNRYPFFADLRTQLGIIKTIFLG
jgi:glycosyltransferase involved in cell wall biosynthesis